MFQLFRTPKFEFMKWRNYAFVLSGLMVLGSLSMLVMHGSGKGNFVNYGIDFAGGSQFEVRFVDTPAIETIRGHLKQEGFGDAAIQRYGDLLDNSVLVRVSEQLEANRELVKTIRRALRSDAETAKEDAGLVDINTAGEEQLTQVLTPLPVDAEAGAPRDPAYRAAARGIMKLREAQALSLFTDLTPLRAMTDITPEMMSALETKCFLGTFAFRRIESVGPAVGDDLKKKAVFASIVACGLILAYLWVRFEFRFGVAAVLCLIHDLLVVLGLFALTDRLFDLTVVAAILTVIGYSVNDTIVVFDRIRSNLKRMRQQPLESIINSSINETLSRTLITSGTTLLAVVALYLFGGEVLNGFAFALLIGVIVGTFSSIFVASPLVLVWHRAFDK